VYLPVPPASSCPLPPSKGSSVASHLSGKLVPPSGIAPVDVVGVLLRLKSGSIWKLNELSRSGHPSLSLSLSPPSLSLSLLPLCAAHSENPNLDGCGIGTFDGATATRGARAQTLNITLLPGILHSHASFYGPATSAILARASVPFKLLDITYISSDLSQRSAVQFSDPLQHPRFTVSQSFLIHIGRFTFDEIFWTIERASFAALGNFLKS